LEKTIDRLNSEIEQLRDENEALRENNIKFQVESFKLGKRIKELEGNEHSYRAYVTKSQDSENQNNSDIHDEEIIIEEIEEIIDEDACYDEIEARSVPLKDEQDTYDDDDQDEAEETQRSPNESRNASQFSDHLTKSQISELSSIKSGTKSDSLFVCKLLMMLFDKETLIDSSITGRPSKNKSYETKGQKTLDKKKLLICKRKELRFEIRTLLK
jgi:hypothetical protein